MNSKKVPSVILPDRIWRAPINIITALTIPSNPVAESVISEVAVSVLSTFSSSLCTPAANTFSSRSSA